MLKKTFHLLPKNLKNIIYKLSNQFYNNIEDDFIFNPEIGKKYNLNTQDKKQIVERIKKSISKIDSATDINIHFVLLKKI